MMIKQCSSLVILAAFLRASMCAATTNPVVIKGYRFFDSVTGEYFGTRGVDYYPRPNTGALDANNLDLFTEDFKSIWQRDIPQFEALNANAIRLYAVDPKTDHSAFMCALQSAGIYVIVDMGANCEGCEITADEAPACYPASYKQRGIDIINEFSKYTNVLAFSGGNEINHRTAGNPAQWNAPCQKKFVRDMRAYIDMCSSSKSMRKIPVGVVMADTDREANAAYYNCKGDDDPFETVEWYGINVYVECDDISDPTQATGFNELRDSFKSLKMPVPTLLTEFGCTSTAFPTVDGYAGQRTFHDAKWMNMVDYSEYFAGGFEFEYSTENANSQSTSAYPFTSWGPQNYGLGYLSPEDCDDVTTPCKFVRMPNFDSLAKAYKATDTSGDVKYDTFKPAADRTGALTCPANFPKISSLTWAGDSLIINSGKCPSVVKQGCPSGSSYGSFSATSSTSSSASASEASYSDSESASETGDESFSESGSSSAFDSGSSESAGTSTASSNNGGSSSNGDGSSSTGTSASRASNALLGSDSTSMHQSIGLACLLCLLSLLWSM